MDEQIQKYWDEFIKSNPSADTIYQAMCAKKEYQIPGWEYLNNRGKLDNSVAFGILINCPKVEDEAWRWLGTLTAKQAVIAIQQKISYSNRAFEQIKHNTDALVELLHTNDQEVVDKTMNKLGNSLYSNQIVDILTNSWNSEVFNHVKERMWHQLKVNNVSDSDLQRIVGGAPDSYKQNAAERLYKRTDNSSTKEEMRRVLINLGNTYLMNESEKKTHFKDKLGF